MTTKRLKPLSNARIVCPDQEHCYICAEGRDHSVHMHQEIINGGFDKAAYAAFMVEELYGKR